MLLRTVHSGLKNKYTILKTYFGETNFLTKVAVESSESESR
jgi:hypothetical protein